MGAPYIARAPKKVLVRIPRNEGYTTVPSGMATLRLIPSPLDKPQDTESTHTEPRGASPLDRPQQFTTSVPPAYTRNIHTESLSEQPVNPDQQQQTSPGVSNATVQLGPPRAAAAAVVSEADRSVVLQGTRPGPRGQAAQYQDERSSSPGHGHLAAAAAAAATIAPRSPALHYQGHFTAISGRCQQEAATAWRQQQPPPFTDFIAGQVWRALMMASQQQQQHQQQQQQQQQEQVSGVVRGPVGGKRTRDVGATTMEGDTDEPTRKMSRVSQAQHGLQDASVAAMAGHSPSVMYSPAGTASHTAFHTAMPTPPTTPPSTQQTCSSPSADDTVHLAQPSSPKRLTHPQQPLMPLSPPALHLPIMFPPVFPQSMTSIKGPQQFSLRSSNNSSSSGSGPVAVSGSGGGGGEGLGAGPPQHQASQLTVGLSPVANPLPHHHHPLAALLQPTHGPAIAAHTEPAAIPYLTAVTPTPMAIRMAKRNGEHHLGGTTAAAAPTGLYRGPVPVYNSSSSNAKTSSNRNSAADSSSSSSRAPPAHPTVGAATRTSPVNSDSSTTLTSHCT